MNAETVAARLKFRDEDVLNVYVVGSRLWGTATEASDYDVYVVHCDNSHRERRSLHSGVGIDAIAVHRDEFEQRLKEHRFLELVCNFAPRNLVWRERFRPRVQQQAIDVRRLVESTLEEASRDWAMSRKFVEKADAHRGVRVAGHMLRMIRLASLMACSGGSAVKWDSGNDLAALSNGLEGDVCVRGWAAIEETLGPVRARLIAELEATVPAHQPPRQQQQRSSGVRSSRS